MVEKPNEEQLIKQAKNGDKTAIATLYEDNVDKIFRYIAYRVPQSDAEDLTAEVFVRMVEGLRGFVYTGAPFEAWLYKIAAARVADFFRKHGKRQHDEIDESLTDSKPLPEERLSEKQEHKRLREALSQLSEEEQRLLILRFVERRSHEDVAKIIGKNSAAIRTAQHRALKKLAQLLDAGDKQRHYLRGKTRPSE